MHDAIAEWTAIQRVQPDAEIEQRLARLRCYGAAEVAKVPHASSDSRPEVGDPFPATVGQIPEIRARDLSLELLAGAILHHGSLLVRGLLDHEFAAALTEATDKAFQARTAATDGGPRNATRPWYTPCEAWDELSGGTSHAARKWARDCNTLQLVDAPRALVRVVEAFEEAGLPDLIAAYLEEPILWSANKTTLRRVTPDANASWHQDGYFMGPNVRAVDVWVALSVCGPGTDAPGIALVPRRVPTLLEAGGPGAPLETALSLHEVERASGGVTVSPTFAPGDALLFDERAVHSTDGSKTTWTLPRFALEAWAFGASAFPESYVPFVI